MVKMDEAGKEKSLIEIAWLPHVAFQEDARNHINLLSF